MKTIKFIIYKFLFKKINIIKIRIKLNKLFLFLDERFYINIIA